MKLLTNIVLPLILAFIAGVLNFAVLSRTSVTYSYVTVTSDLKPGEQFDLSQLDQVTVSAKVPGAILWEDRNVLATLSAPRSLLAGDWVMQSDVVPDEEAGIQLQSDEVALNVSLNDIIIEPKLLKIGQPIGFAIRDADASTTAVEGGSKPSGQEHFRIVGPFRLVSLGEIAKQEIRNEDADQGEFPKTISVAVPAAADKKLDAESQLLTQAIEQTRIVAIVLYPRTKVTGKSKSDEAASK